MAAPFRPTGDVTIFITTLRPNGKAERYPDKGDLDEPIDGFYVMNESTTTNLYVRWDGDATGGDNDLFVPVNDFRNVGAHVEKFISVYAASLVVVNLIGYRRRA